MDTSKLITRVVIEVQGTQKDEAGQPVKAWSELCRVWGDVAHKSGVQALKSDAPASIVQASVRVRWRTDITPAMRLRIKDVIYQILAVLPDLRRREYVDLVCQLVAGHG